MGLFLIYLRFDENNYNLLLKGDLQLDELVDQKQNKYRRRKKERKIAKGI